MLTTAEADRMLPRPTDRPPPTLSRERVGGTPAGPVRPVEEWPPFWREAWEERVAILTIDGGVPEAEARRLATEEVGGQIRHSFCGRRC